MKKIFTALFVLCLAIPASAQFTITSSDYLARSSNPQTFTQYQSTNAAGLQALINQSGANQTWTFGGTDWTNAGTYTDAGAQLQPYPSGAALASNFPTATHVIANTSGNVTIYDFYQINDNGAWILGETQDSAGMQSVVLSYTPGLQVFKFPLTYQTSWYSSSSIPASEFGAPNGTTITEVSDGLVDGFGTLSVPGHSEQTLRLRWRSNITATYLTIVAYSVTSINYSWLTESNYGASITTDSNQTTPTHVTGGSYDVPTGAGVTMLPHTEDPLTLRLSQNPASNTETNLSYIMPKDGPVQVMLMDPLGRDVKMLVDGTVSVGTHLVPIDPASLSNGNYFLRVSADGKVATMKLVIAK